MKKAVPAPVVGAKAVDDAKPETPTSVTVDPTALDLTASSAAFLEAQPPRRKIPHNPSAGEVHRREQGASWRIEAEEQIRQGNARAREEQAEKRRWGLAKQVQDGLMHNFGINYGVAELAALIKEGLSLRSQGKVELSPTEVTYVQLLVAAEKYDLKQLALLIDKFPKGRNAAGKKGSS